MPYAGTPFIGRREIGFSRVPLTASRLLFHGLRADIPALLSRPPQRCTQEHMSFINMSDTKS
jgi:hypothetical protein